MRAERQNRKRRKRDAAQEAEGKVNAPAEENVLWAAALTEDPAHTEMTCSLLNGLYHVVEEWGRRECSWTELLSCNSPTTQYAVYPTPRGVYNELLIGSVTGKKYRLFLSTSTFCVATHKSLAAVINPSTSTCQAYIFSHVLLLSLPPSY